MKYMMATFMHLCVEKDYMQMELFFLQRYDIYYRRAITQKRVSVRLSMPND